MSLQNLPQELYYAILSEVPTTFLRRTTLNLSRAMPHSPIPLQFLFESVTITRPEQVPQLYRRLKFYSKEPGLECLWIKSFTLLEWAVDADVLINTLVLCTSLNHLSLRIGPVFAPEHLEDLFRRPFHSLISLNIRFRPYVKTATYYQFLKGSYFDSIFEHMSNWTSGELKRLSITQDPLPAQNPNEKGFAQPMVFFSFAPLKALSASFSVQALTHLRLNIPSRRFVPYLTESSSSSSIFDIRAFPSLISLDLSSCVVHAADLPLLINFIGRGHLKHLILDCAHVGNGNVVEWEAIGKAIALADVAPSREREKVLKAWASAPPSTAAQNEQSPTTHNFDMVPHKRGRKGLATATISLRERPAGHAIKGPPESISPATIQQLGKLKIVPTVPRLQFLCINGLSNDTEDMARSEFTRGWTDGLRRLRATWTRLLQSQSNGGSVRLFRFGASSEWNPASGSIGLVEIGPQGQDDFWDCLASSSISPPLLCSATSAAEMAVMRECRHTDIDGSSHFSPPDIWPAEFT